MNKQALNTVNWFLTGKKGWGTVGTMLFEFKKLYGPKFEDELLVARKYVRSMLKKEFNK